MWVRRQACCVGQRLLSIHQQPFPDCSPPKSPMRQGTPPPHHLIGPPHRDCHSSLSDSDVQIQRAYQARVQFSSNGLCLVSSSVQTPDRGDVECDCVTLCQSVLTDPQQASEHLCLPARNNSNRLKKAKKSRIFTLKGLNPLRVCQVMRGATDTAASAFACVCCGLHLTTQQCF